jgi:hypothetical protein
MVVLKQSINTLDKIHPSYVGKLEYNRTFVYAPVSVGFTFDQLITIDNFSIRKAIIPFRVVIQRNSWSLERPACKNSDILLYLYIDL